MTPTSELKLFTTFGIVIGFTFLAYAANPLLKNTAEIPGKYIVVLKEGNFDSDKTITDIEKKHGVSAEIRYSKALKGFSAKLSSAKLAKMKTDPRVAFINEDRVVTIDGKPAFAAEKSKKEHPVQENQPASPSNSNLLPNSNSTQTNSTVTETQPVPEVRNEPSQEQVGREVIRNENRGIVEDKKETVATSSDSNIEASGKGTRGKPIKAEPTPIAQPAQPAQIIPTGISRIDAINNVNKGTGIGVAVIDTGIDLTHPDLVANLSPVSKTCVAGTLSAQDDNGHGTHVAGTIAASNNSVGAVGVAPEATLYAVKVLDSAGSGTWSSIICGIDWITANAKTLNIKVANMSLGGVGTSDNNCGLTNNDALHRALCNSTAQGVTYVVAAGNNGADASQFVPASYSDTVITVSALADSDGLIGGTGVGTSYGADDTFASFSNYGAPVDIAAPGVNIFSTWKGGTYKTISGTSMASPHAAGASALYIKTNPTALWSQVRSALRTLGELLGSGHLDPSNLHPEPVVKANFL